MSNFKVRATILDIPGKERYEIIRAAISRFNDAIKQGYYLEATALMESLISDRLESRLGELKKRHVTFDTIGNLTSKLNKVESDPILKEIMNKGFNQWCGQRNICIHQAAKIELSKKKDWLIFLKQSEDTAKEGRKLFNAYNTRLNKVRKTKQLNSKNS